MRGKLISWRVSAGFLFSALIGLAQCEKGLDLGGLTLHCHAGNSTQSDPLPITGEYRGTFNIGAKPVQFNNQTLSALRQLIVQESDHVATSELKAAGSQSRLVIHSKSPGLTVTGQLISSQGKTLSLTAATSPDFILSLDPDSRTSLASKEIKVLVHQDGDVDLVQNDWNWNYDSPPLVRVTIESPHDKCDQNKDALKSDLFHAACQAQFLLARTSDYSDIVRGAEVEPTGLKVFAELLNDKGSTYTINGRTLKAQPGPRVLPITTQGWRVNWYANNIGCRFYDTRAMPGVTMPPPPKSAAPNTNSSTKGNGITVGAAKVFDVTALRQMLTDTANQLASISGFNAAAITGALTNVQGLIRDAKFFNVQISTAATPSIAGTNSSVSGTNSNVTTTPGPATPQTNSVTVQCPDGTLPNIATNGAIGCATASGTTGPTGANVTTTNTPSVSPTTVTTAAAPTVTNTTTTTTPSVTATIPTQPASTAFSAPSNVGLSSSDVLAEQVELNAEITTLRLLLQGALSDQYLLKNSRAVDSRQQTTIGFSVALNPPPQFKNAVAEVRVVVVPPEGADPVSIMNLLPADKTYNVARITSDEKAFGIGVALQVLSFGLSAGNSKDRLFMAKDADTVSLQFARDMPESKSAQSDPADSRKRKKEDQKNATQGPEAQEMPGNCRVPDTNENTMVFGWQFRPVFEAEYVASGRRQVFAQIALSGGDDSSDPPKVYVQTVWRTYDNKTQSVGGVLEDTCLLEPDSSATALVDQPTVRNMHLTDLGAGQVKLTGSGEFFSTSLSVLSGANTSVPLAFDGKEVEVFGNAHDLLESGDLIVVGANGRHSPFAISTRGNRRCGITAATLTATPRPDGNSVARLELTLGADYKPASGDDGAVNPFVLIGKQVYGIREYPFLHESGQDACDSQSAKCSYTFIAPTADLRNAQTFLARDLTWDRMSATGRIAFLPSFISLASLTAAATDDQKAATDISYSVTGYDFDRLDASDKCETAAPAEPGRMCLTVFVGGHAKTPDFHARDRNMAILKLKPAEVDGLKSLQFQVSPSGKKAEDSVADSIVWDLPLPAKSPASKPIPSPGYLREGDSEKVTFSGVTFTGLAAGTNPSIQFETCNLSQGVNYDPKAKTLDVIITTCVTAHPGHKDLLATVPGGTGSSAKPAVLSIDVLRQ